MSDLVVGVVVQVHPEGRTSVSQWTRGLQSGLVGEGRVEEALVGKLLVTVGGESPGRSLGSLVERGDGGPVNHGR